MCNPISRARGGVPTSVSSLSRARTRTYEGPALLAVVFPAEADGAEANHSACRVNNSSASSDLQSIEVLVNCPHRILGMSGTRETLAEELISPVDMFEGEVISFIRRIIGLYKTISNDQAALDKLRKIFDPLTLGCMALMITLHKPMLRKTHSLYTHVLTKLNKRSRTIHGQDRQYEGSLLSHLENGFEAGVLSFASIYALDFLLVIYVGLGFKHSMDVTGVASSVLARVVFGLFATQTKDWFLMKRRIFISNKIDEERDPRRENVINELTSTLIWMFIIVGIIERLSSDLKVSVSSIFAFGGIGSATLVIALKSVFENFVGGIMLRIQDKFRVNDKIQTAHDEGGWVQKINAFSTVIRREDDTNVVIPNGVFIHDIVTNWSRAPYRRFRTEVDLPLKQVERLPLCIQNIRNRVENVHGIVEKDKRDLLITAGRFSYPSCGNTEDQQICITVDAHIYKDKNLELSKVKTNIVREVGLAMKESTLNIF